jgi:hypothetical protein
MKSNIRVINIMKNNIHFQHYILPYIFLLQKDYKNKKIGIAFHMYF